MNEDTGLDVTDVVGETIDVKIVSADWGETPTEEKTLNLRVSRNGDTTQVGIIGEELAQQVLADHGKEKDGNKYLEIQGSKFQPEADKISWINSPY